MASDGEDDSPPNSEKTNTYGHSPLQYIFFVPEYASSRLARDHNSHRHTPKRPEMTLRNQMKMLHRTSRATFSTTSSSSPQSIAATLRQRDYDGYVCGLLLPSTARNGYFAVRALNAEIATIKQTTHGNALTAKMRMQWWREQLHSIFQSTGKVQPHPVLIALKSAHDEHQFTRRWVENLLDARDQDLDHESTPNIDALETYAEQSSSSLMYLILECLNVRDEEADVVASHAGIAQGICTMLRGSPYHISQREFYWPTELMEKYDCTEDDFYAAMQDPESGNSKCSKVVKDIASTARAHLEEARALQGSLPRKALPAFLSTVSTSLFLDELAKQNYNVFAKTVHSPSHQLRYLLHLLKHRMLNNF